MTAGVRRSAIRSPDGTLIAYQSLGSGEGAIVVGGALRSGYDYLPLAQELAAAFVVHLVDRRGRGESGPQGPDYGIDAECEDLLALQAETGATAVFGHSFGGLVALETARRTEAFSLVAVYEPGVSINGSIPCGWLPRYRELLTAGDTRGAFACMLRQSGFAPGPIAKMPLWYVRAIVRVAVRGRQWHHMESLLGCNLAEHEQVARLDEGSADRYGSINAPVLLLGGQKSPAFITTTLFEALGNAIPDSESEILEGLDHFAPDEKAPQVVAERIVRFRRSRAEAA